MDSNLKKLEDELFNHKGYFTDRQKYVLTFNKSIDVIAGPGTGKTTTLIAKISLALKENQITNKGICVITHTNVAVDEITSKINKFEVGELEYPNFIGTIQEFINKFFSKNALYLLFGKTDFRVLDDKDYKKSFNNVFSKIKPAWYDRNPPNPLNKKIIINYNNEEKVAKITSNANKSYRDAFDNSIENLLSNGIINNRQCIELSLWYIEKYSLKIKKALAERFNYVFLDEAQDTSMEQFTLLNNLFESESNIAFQKYGDPSQALYNIFGENEEDAWLPILGNNDVIEISETMRFGDNIAKIVGNFNLYQKSEFKSLNIVESFPPHFIIYKDINDLLDKYSKIIHKFQSDSVEFLDSKKKDAIITIKHKDLQKLFSDYSKVDKYSFKSEILVYQEIIFSVLKSKMNNISEYKNDILNSLEYRKNISMLIKEYIRTEEIYLNRISELLNCINFKENIIKDEEIEVIKSEIEMKFQSITFSKKTKDKRIYKGTIHSVKGETHRSTMLIMDSTLKNYYEDEEEHILDLVEDYLVGNYIPLNEITNLNRKKKIRNALKLIYVALSRANYLIIIALPQQKTKKELTEKLIELGWKGCLE